MKRIVFLYVLLCVVSAASHAQSGTKTTQMKDLNFTVKGLSFTMIAVQGGSFTMGATYEQIGDNYEDEEPTHKVTLNSFYIGKFEVTQDLWVALMGENPSFYRNDRCPVDCVSWNDCQQFIAKLNQLTGKKFRLPTEAEWEYAARGGVKSREYKFSGAFDVEKVAICGLDWNSNARPVGSKAPNELGIYDMSGNVYEWCNDWYGRYRSEDQENPKGVPTGTNRVMRGGSWFMPTNYARVSNRSGAVPDARYIHIGFRLALSAQ